MLAHQLGQSRQVGLPPDQRRAGFGEVGRQAGQLLPLAVEVVWGGHRDTVGGDGEDGERAPNILQPELAQVDEGEERLVLQLVVDRVADRHAAGEAEGLDPGRDVDGVADDPRGLNHDIADMDADTDRYLQILAECSLHLYGTAHRIERTLEDAHRPIAQVLDDSAASCEVLLVQDSGVLVPLGPSDGLVLLHERGVAHHVGEHDRGQLAMRLSR